MYGNKGFGKMSYGYYMGYIVDTHVPVALRKKK
jgi:hypothetical protein